MYLIDLSRIDIILSLYSNKDKKLYCAY